VSNTSGNLKHYANQHLQTSFELEPIRLTPEHFLLYKGGMFISFPYQFKQIDSIGLEEVTYNLQESQDFFDASLDGRLHKYHEIEKNLIEAQLQVCPVALTVSFHFRYLFIIFRLHFSFTFPLTSRSLRNFQPTSREECTSKLS
jgi:hypothetical protein